jgi:hypothetical protein
MAAPTGMDEYDRLIAHLARWWQRWQDRRVARAEIERLSGAASRRLPRDLGTRGADLATFAGKWPDAESVMAHHVASLRLTAAEMGGTESTPMSDRDRASGLRAAGSPRAKQERQVECRR